MRSHHDTVSPRRFGSVERPVGGFHQFLRIRIRFRFRHAEGSGHRKRRPCRHPECQRPDSLPDSLRHARAFVDVGARQCDAEFIPSKPSGQVRRPQFSAHDVADRFQNFIRGSMSKSIVDIFEKVDIEQAESRSRLLDARSPQRRLQPRPEMVPVGKACRGIVVRLPGELVLRGLASRDVLRDADNLFHQPVRAAFESRLTPRKPDPVTIGVPCPVLKQPHLAILRVPQCLMMSSDHHLIVGMYQGPARLIHALDLLRLVTQNCDDLAVAVDISLLHQIENVEDTRRRGRNPLHEMPAFLQLKLGALAFGDFARNRLKSGHLVLLDHQLHVLPDPAVMAVSVDDGKFVIGALLAARELADVKSLCGPALVLPDQLHIGTSDHFGLTEVQQRECGLVAENESATFVGPVNDVSRQFDDAPVLLLFDREFLFHAGAFFLVRRHSPARDYDQTQRERRRHGKEDQTCVRCLFLPRGSCAQ